MKNKKQYCFTCGTIVIHKSNVYGYDERTREELIHSWVECPNKPKWWEIMREWYHPVTKYEGLPYL